MININISLKTWFYIAIIVIFLGLGVTTVFLYRELKSTIEQLNDANTNVEAYQGMLSGAIDDNYALKLELSDLSDSNDKAISSLNKTRKELKIKDNELREMAMIQSHLVDTFIDTMTVNEDCSFHKDIEFNSETHVYLDYQGGELYSTIDVSNTDSLFVFDRREYVNKGKSWVKRLITWDWKKKNTSQYMLKRSNEAIRSEDVRVIIVKKED